MYLYNFKCIIYFPIARYYFKTKVEGDLYYEEVREDCSQVPRWQGKVWVECHHQP